MIVSQYSVMRGIRNTDETVAGKNDGFPINTTTVETTVVNDGDANKSITPEEEEEMENKTFILSEPERLEVVSDADVERAFYVSLDEDKLKKEVKEHLDGIRNQKKRSTILANTLENIISDREFLLMSSDEDMDLDGGLCIRLANNNQSFADEYKLQGGKPQTVVFYYVETIKRTEDGLAYEDLPQGYRSKYTRYLKARYKDIADYIENNLEGFGTEREKYRQIMEKANAIYKTM